MRLLITGAAGQLGFDALREARRRGFDCTGVDREDFDLTDAAAVAEALQKTQPEAILHCAAYTAVDKAEEESALAMAINKDATHSLARYCDQTGALLLYISTDYVFNGSGCRPWEAEDTPAPLSVYGKTKLAGERAASLCPRHMIVRTSWVFGANGGNFVKTMLRLGRERETLRVVNDQIGAPTYTVDLARLLCDMLEQPQPGIYHASNGGECSWAGFAQEIFRQTELPTQVIPVPSSEYPQAARRPKNSRLSPRSLLATGYAPLPDWQGALERFLCDFAAQNK
ncbi:MAG: dTDP-4-dehydrorhamnose reductase [Oscillospiraceae bacterium]|jgi:dTDP-4-dehydrorhamnose reductase|nr:dTDP-4-dehydrorhamnose reductase [Oscillospiraceae bacterium]